MSILTSRRRPASTVTPTALVALPKPDPARVDAFAAWLRTADQVDVDKEIADCLTRLDLYRREMPELVPTVAGEYAALQAALNGAITINGKAA